MKKFWNWVKNEAGRTLRLDGIIASDSWGDDAVTPKAFRADLFDGSGPVTVWINSPGGDLFAGTQIYNMLAEYSERERTAGALTQAADLPPGADLPPVTVKIDALAASAASVLAMAGDAILISRVGIIMIHNPSTFAWGDSEEMRKAKACLDELKEALINAYETRTGLSRPVISRMMDEETWMDARKAVDLGFADGILGPPQEGPADVWGAGLSYSSRAAARALYGKIIKERSAPAAGGRPAAGSARIAALEKRLALIPR